MLKETKTEETLGIVVIIFIVGGISIWGASLLVPLRYAYYEVGPFSYVFCISTTFVLLQ